MQTLSQLIRNSFLATFACSLASSAAMAAVTIEPIGAGDMFRFFPEASVSSQISNSFTPIDPQSRTRANFQDTTVLGEVDMLTSLDDPRGNVSLTAGGRGVSFHNGHVTFRIQVIDATVANKYGAGDRLFTTTAKLTVKNPMYRSVGPSSLKDFGSISVQCGTTLLKDAPGSYFFWVGEERSIDLSLSIDRFDFAKCRDNIFVVVFAKASTSVSINEVNWYVSNLE